MSRSRSVLLVGEGNFSFSAALCHLSSEMSVTATCLQPQEEAMRQEGAFNNMQIIKDSGGKVIFEVDSTKLGECASLRGHLFDRVVFNFPHCGRKSGVKKNRQLLKDFFLSCVQVLAEEGEVHVSLCNGQGGTPADQPRRERHNSWQVVAVAAEANLILSDVRPFESEKYQGYKCTGYRSQDKGFHLENALLHVFTRSAPFSCPPVLKMEETVEGEKVQYDIPAELSDYMTRCFLTSDSVHPVKLVQDFLLERLREKSVVSMVTEALPVLLSAKQLQLCCPDIDHTLFYWIHACQKKMKAEACCNTTEELKCQVSVSSKPANPAVSCKGVEGMRSLSTHDVDLEEETALYILRPSLRPQMEALIAKKAEWTEMEYQHVNAENSLNWSLLGISGIVFQNIPVNYWALPVFHELLFTGLLLKKDEPLKVLEQTLGCLLAPYGVSAVTEQEGLHLMAQPMGLIGKVLRSSTSDNNLFGVTVSLNLDLLAVLMFSLPDWRLLWSPDPRFLQQFVLRPAPGTPFTTYCLFPELYSFDISFWTGTAWENKKFHALVREASCGTVEHIKLIDKFSHPDLSQTSYCYRLIYHSHTHALSHTQALQFHKRLEELLSLRLDVTIR
ncbi:ferredoxin-fold anticodon-binding domain-containing protein 1 isoform X1 [Corythoichthys intestinalis]|uniref:ferredoxin-fold anticodon-binding domain-containing protein 1 isoform X1 n=1 Tax=Corythoichthys intestinalis TaxID=161448 RepID=UPI0025A67F0C|nr:ferredoxin-fold anticodon-binding domain-containing protein 1 isoform X1 [Corythoichthys intestinalis]